MQKIKKMPALITLSAILVAFLLLGSAIAQEEPSSRCGLVTLNEKPLTLAGKDLNVGEKAPGFTLLDEENHLVGMEYFQEKILVYALKRYREEKGMGNAVFLSDHINTGFGKDWGVLLEEIRLLARGFFIVDEEGTLRYTQVSHDELFTKNLNYEDIMKAFDSLALWK